MQWNKFRQKGFSLVEVMLASVVLSGVVAGAMTLQNVTFNRTVSNNDKAFATQKAMQMFEELRAFVQANRESDIAKLQNFSDGSSYNPVLTTEKREVSTSTGMNALDLSDPADPLSGNRYIGGTGKWKFLRQIRIQPVPNDLNARYVTVGVWYASEQNNTVPKGDVERPLAVISGVLKTNISQDPPTQMYDLFVVGIENSPSWWVDQADLRPSFERTLLDLEQRNPGLIFRRHFISRNGFGRDPYYLPYVNDANNANAQDLPWVYLYPGAVNNALTQNYLLDNLRSRLRTDTATEFRPLDRQNSNYSSTNPYRHYALADQFNHVMRFPEQRAMEERLKAEDPDTFRDSPSLVTFLEDLNRGDVYKNAIIINIHGELLPLPPIRNYADPAKTPDKHARTLTGDPSATVPADNSNTNSADFVSLRNKRVVTHPENLRYNNASTVSWRVYPFEDYASTDTVTRGGLPNDAGGNISRDFNVSNPATGIISTIPRVSLFIPTRGSGPHYSGSGSGYLQNYPNFTPASVAGLTIERLVGGRLNGTAVSGFQPYAWWTTSTGTDNTATTIGTLNETTDTHAPCTNSTASTSATFTCTLNTAARFVGGGVFSTTLTANATVTGAASNYHNPIVRVHNNTSAYNVTTNPGLTPVVGTTFRSMTFTHNFTATAQNALLGSLIVLGSGTPNQKVVRIDGFPAANRISFQPAVTVVTSTGGANDILRVPVVRHKDFDARVVDKNIYGHPEKGILITLYDSPTRHNCFADASCNTASATGGLDNADQLDGLEYIPAPVNGVGATAFTNRDLTNTSNEFKNTARWRVSLNTASYGTNFNDRMLTLETRMVSASVPGDPAVPAPVPFLDSNTNSIYDPCEVTPASGSVIGSASSSPATVGVGGRAALEEEGVLCDGLWGDGDAYAPNLGSTAGVNEHETTQRTNLYNVSRTYTWMNHVFTEAQGTTLAGGASVTSDVAATALIVPRVEQAQFQGHPLYNPYLDVKTLHRYNRHFADIRTAANGYSSFERAIGVCWDNVHIDLNWFFQLYSNGIVRSNAIYNSISGYSNYYYAFGGENGTDGTNAFFDVRSQPWAETDTGTAAVRNDNITMREILRDGGAPGGDRVIFSTDATTAGAAGDRWRMRQYLGQLFPDPEILFWENNGNLPTLDYNNANHNAVAAGPSPLPVRYFRASSNDTPRALGYTTARRIAGTGAPSFMNANAQSNPSGSNLGLNHISSDGTAVLTNAAATDAGSLLMNSFNLTLSDQLPSNRPFWLENGSLANGAYDSLEIAAIRNRSRYLNTSTGVTSATSSTQNVYYRHDSDFTTRTSSAFVRLTRPNPTTPANDLTGMVGYVLVNGLNAAAGTGTQEIARFSQAASLQSFMDAGDRSVPGVASGRTVQLPRVKVADPRSSQVYDKPTSIAVNLNVAWLRWDDKPYSPAYPATWRDSTRLLYNIKYSSNNKRTWKYADDKSDVSDAYLDQFNPSHSLMSGPETSTANSWNKSYSWNVATLPAGNYVLRVEVYREGFQTGYSYHDVFVTITR